MSHALVVNCQTFTRLAARERKQTKIYSIQFKIRFIFATTSWTSLRLFLFIRFGKVSQFLHVEKIQKSSSDGYVPFPIKLDSMEFPKNS